MKQPLRVLIRDDQLLLKLAAVSEVAQEIGLGWFQHRRTDIYMPGDLDRVEYA